MNWRVEVAQHAAERSATVVHREMGRGLSGLATVAVTAPFVGILGNAVGIFESFRGVCGDKPAIMAATAGSLSDSLVPAAFGLGVGVIALVGYQCLSAALTEFEVEMRCAILELPAALRRGRL